MRAACAGLICGPTRIMCGARLFPIFGICPKVNLHPAAPLMPGCKSEALLQVGERVSIACSPMERSVQSVQRGRFRPFGSGPPFTKPGQPLSATNHDTGREHALQPPPSSAAGIPGWALPAAVLFSASDAASGEL